MIRLVQILCVIALVGVLYAFRSAFLSMRDVFDGAGFPVGFMCGALLFALIWWISERFDDKSSRTRDTSSKQQ